MAKEKLNIIDEREQNDLVFEKASSAGLERLEMHPELVNFRSPNEQKKALLTIAGLEEGMVFIARRDKVIVGYVTFHYPDEYSRWRKHPGVLELGGIEVARSFRNRHIGSGLLETAFGSGLMEKHIVVTTEYFRHWDMQGNHLDIWGYRELLDRLFGKVGFSARPTDDPDITEHPANVLMARFGSGVTREEVMIFEQMAFTKPMLW